MARKMVKTKRPFDSLIYWNEYIDYINQEFSAPEENTKWKPQVNIKEKDNGYELKLKIPGFSLQDIEISYKNDCMIIEGNKKALLKNRPEINKSGDGYYDNFKSVVHFPEGIQQSRIKKALKNSTLEIQVPARKNQIGKQ